MRITPAAILAATVSLAATSSIAAPSQLILGQQQRNTKSPSTSHREPDFVDVLEAEAARPSSLSISTKGNEGVSQSLWPPSPSPGDGSGGWVWASCGDSSDPVQIKSIEVSPDPPQPGKNMTVTAKGTLHGRLEEGAYADVVVKLGLIKLLSRRIDICEEAKANNVSLQCPVEDGEHEVTHTVELPREIPPAKFNVHVSAFTAEDDDLMCLDLSIDFRKH